MLMFLTRKFQIPVFPQHCVLSIHFGSGMETAVVANEAPQPKEQAVISDEQKEKQENKKRTPNSISDYS